MLTISKSDEDLFGAIAAGADGYLLKNAEPEELKKSIMLVNQGFSVLSPLVTRKKLNKVTLDKPSENDLSGREIEVLACLAQGMTTAQVCSELFISENIENSCQAYLGEIRSFKQGGGSKKATILGLFNPND